MTAVQWQSVKSLFMEAIALPDAERDAFFRDLELADLEVSAQLRRLLAEPVIRAPDIRSPCWTVAPQRTVQRTFVSGQTLSGRFEITGFLGAGGIGEVYRALDRQQRISVAVKTIRTGMISDHAALSMLRNELNTARSVTHPNVCRLHDFHWETDAATPPYFTMELLDGDTLATRLARQGPFSTAAALPILTQMIDGLRAAHHQGIVHRDLKPGNVMLAEPGSRVVLMDFGLARDLKTGGDLETTLSTNNFAGTPAYMAPEQLRGEAAIFASDVHALGAVMFEMVTGERPFNGATPLEVASRRLNGQAPSPRRRVPELDRRWERAILQCLASDASKRPPLDSVLLLLAADPPSRLLERRTFMAGGLAAVAAVAGAAYFTRGGFGTAEVELADIGNETGEPTFAYLCRGTTSEILRRVSRVKNVTVIPLHATAPGPSSRQASRFLLTGNLRKDGEGLRITLQLADRSTSRPVWSGSFNRKTADDMLQLQTEIAEGVTVQLERYLGRSAAGPSGSAHSGDSPANAPTRNGEALDAYMRARYLLEQASPSSTRAAVTYLRQAVEKDDRFALAWSALADANVSLTVYITGPESANLLDEAAACGQRAVDLEPNLAEGHLSLAAVRQNRWDWTGAEQSYREALRLKPAFSRAHRWYAGFVLQFGRFEEAIHHSRTALQQDPYDQMGPLAVGLYLLFAGNTDEAIRLMEPAVAGKDLESVRHNLGQAFTRKAQLSRGTERLGWVRKALEQAEVVSAVEHRKKNARPLLSDRLYSLIHAATGNAAAAQPYLNRLTEDMRNGRYSPADVAWVHALNGNHSLALDLLEQAFAHRDRSLLYVKVNPFLENLRSEPRFETLIHHLRL